MTEAIGDSNVLQECEAPRTGQSARDLIFVFHGETWADAVGHLRPMGGPRLLATLMDEPSVRRLLVANPYRSAPIQWIRFLSGQRPPSFPTDSHRALVEPRRLRRRDPTSIRALERAYLAYDHILERASDRLGAHRPAVIATHPFVAAFCPLHWAGRVTYFGRDEWTAGLPLQKWWPAYNESYKRIRESGRAVIGVSKAILDRISPTGFAKVIPNGVTPEEWLAPALPPNWFSSLRSPRIVYAGALTSERLDTEAIIQVASRFPNGSVVLVGPMVDRVFLDSLRPYPNVTVHPSVGRDEIASVIHAADVCIIPHLFTNVTRAMSPIKLYEYLAGGRPVAASDLPPVRGVHSSVLLVPQGDNFAAGVAAALERGPLCENDRLAFIEANSWSHRHRQILEIAFGDVGLD